uniref:Transforming growth factor beta receptor 3 n=1 Tax=Ovis aries TaxID=9940 RepID=A0AC11DYC2_SHEEP
MSNQPQDKEVHIIELITPSSNPYRWPKYWSFNFSISPSNEYSRLISFRIDWFDLGVQGTLKSLLQHRSSKASILWHSSFFMVQLSHPCKTPGRITACTILTFVGKAMSLLFNMLSRLVIAVPRSKGLLISWLQSPFAVILEPKKINSVTVSLVSPSICHGVMGPYAMILVF